MACGKLCLIFRPTLIFHRVRENVFQQPILMFWGRWKGLNVYFPTHLKSFKTKFGRENCDDKRTASLNAQLGFAVTFLSSVCEFRVLGNDHIETWGRGYGLPVDSTASAEVPTWIGMVFRSVSKGLQRFPTCFWSICPRHRNDYLIWFTWL